MEFLHLYLPLSKLIDYVLNSLDVKSKGWSLKLNILQTQFRELEQTEAIELLHEIEQVVGSTVRELPRDVIEYGEPQKQARLVGKVDLHVHAHDFERA